MEKKIVSVLWGVIEIEELFFEALPNYTVHFENGNYVKIFDPNYVEYLPFEGE